MSDLKCWNCGNSLADVPRPISRHEQCRICFEALHCCRLCRHYRTDVTGQCDEERADPPVIKENANFCDWFRPAAGVFAGSRVEKRVAAEDKLAALFGDEESGDDEPDDPDDQDVPEDPDSSSTLPISQPASKEDEARSKLDDLFSKD